MSLLGPLLRLLRRLDPREAAAYEAAAREAFKAGIPTATGPSAPSIEVGDHEESRTVEALGRFAGQVPPEGATTSNRRPPPRSKPPQKELGSEGTTVVEPTTEGRATDPDSREVADGATDLLRTPRSVTPVVDDFFDGLIRRVEGKR